MYKGNIVKNTINLSLIAMAMLTLNGCGGDPRSSNGNPGANNTDNIKQIKYDLQMAHKLVTGEQKTSCLPTGDGKGMVISQVASGSTIQFDCDEYDNEQCSGDVTNMLLAEYSLTFGNVTNNGKALEVNLKFDHGDDIVDKIPHHILGYDISKTFYTTIIASEDKSKGEYKVGFAVPTDSVNGSSSDSRAKDFSDFTSQKYYFSN